MTETDWQPTRRGALGAIALMCTSIGCSSSNPERSLTPITRLATQFDREVRQASQPLRLHPSHSKSTQLPSDYSTFLATFGGGTFDDGRFSFAVADLSVADDSIAEEMFAVLYDRDFRLANETLTGFRDIPGMIPWGHDHQETTFYWVADQQNPDDWKVAINDLAGSLLVHSNSMTEFLASCLLDRVSFYSDKRFDQRNLCFVPSRAG